MPHRLTDTLFHRVCLTILSVSVVTILLPLTAFTDELLDNDRGDLTFFAEGKLSEAEDEAEIRDNDLALQTDGPRKRRSHGEFENTPGRRPKGRHGDFQPGKDRNDHGRSHNDFRKGEGRRRGPPHQCKQCVRDERAEADRSAHHGPDGPRYLVQRLDRLERKLDYVMHQLRQKERYHRQHAQGPDGPRYGHRQGGPRKEGRFVPPGRGEWNHPDRPRRARPHHQRGDRGPRYRADGGPPEYHRGPESSEWDRLPEVPAATDTATDSWDSVDNDS